MGCELMTNYDSKELGSGVSHEQMVMAFHAQEAADEDITTKSKECAVPSRENGFQCPICESGTPIWHSNDDWTKNEQVLSCWQKLWEAEYEMVLRTNKQIK